MVEEMIANKIKNSLKKVLLCNDDMLEESVSDFYELMNSLPNGKLSTRTVSLHRTKVKKVTTRTETDQPVNVYDIGMKNGSNPWFFGNNMLLHNSVYFSAVTAFKEQIDSGEIDWNKDLVTEIYDTVCDQANETFPNYMAQAHNVLNKTQGEIIAAGREVCASAGIFIKKKRYAILVYDLEGYREDQDGKPGKVKAMGLDLKRSDTPAFMQDFLSELLLETLTGADENTIINRIIDFRRKFREMPAWEKGTPKRVNKLTYYKSLEWKTENGRDMYKGKANMPGHVRAAINYNRLKDIHGDKYSISIVDGMKTIVCKLKSNPMGFSSIGYPTDLAHVPQWFKELPFADDDMEDTIITKKVENLLGVLDIDLSKAEDKTTFESLFDFG